jgi:hypothetical protein
MRTTTERDFLQWAAGKGLALDPQYPDSAVLDYQGGSDARFWTVPPEPARRPYLIASLLQLLGEWQTCFVWRHLGSWPDPVSADGQPVNDVVESRILQGLGLPLGTSDVVAFDRADLSALITLLFSTTIFGWSVGEDLFVVPDHARQLIQTDHHGVIHVSFRSVGDIEHWVSAMSRNGFDLPEDLPDETFKRPSWMPE